MSNNKFQLTLPTLKPEYVFQAMSEVYDWGLRDLHIPDIHKETMGEGITIAVIDSGQSEHFEVANNILGGKNFSDSPVVVDKNGHSCLHPNGYVWTTRKGIESIENFYTELDKPEIVFDLESSSKYVGDLDIKCLSFNSQRQEFEDDIIDYVHKIPVQDNILCIHFGQGRHVKLTRDHPTYCLRNGVVDKIDAQNLSVGDKLICNNDLRALADAPKIVNYGRYRKCQNCAHIVKIIKEHSGRRQCKKCNKSDFVDSPYTRELNSDWAYLIGLVITDGHLHYQTGERFNKFVQICNSDPDILSAATNILENAGYKVNLYEDKRPGSNSKTLTVYSSELCEFMLAAGVCPGNKTRTQELPLSIQQSSLEVIFGFLAGVIDGDGSIDSKGKTRIASGSLAFTQQLTYFLTSIGLRSRFLKVSDKSEKTISGRTCEFQEAWHITINNPFQIKPYLKSNKASNLKCFDRYRPKTVTITDITNESFEGFFYDFTTRKNHNYQGNGVIISNTFVSGIIAAEKNNEGVIGVAPKSKIYFIKAMDDAGRGGPAQLVQSVEWAIKQKVDIISISAGMFVDFKPLLESIKKAYNKNIIIVAAAGNTGTRHYDVAYPARYSEVIGVAAYDEKRKIAPFSSRGINVSFAMPGVDIYSTWLDNQFVKNNGTSFSAPMLSGICALILAKHRKLGDKSKTPCNTPKQMLEHLIKYSVTIGNDKESSGFGTIDTKSMFLLDEPSEAPKIETKPETPTTVSSPFTSIRRQKKPSRRWYIAYRRRMQNRHR